MAIFGSFLGLSQDSDRPIYAPIQVANQLVYVEKFAPIHMHKLQDSIIANVVEFGFQNGIDSVEIMSDFRNSVEWYNRVLSVKLNLYLENLIRASTKPKLYDRFFTRDLVERPELLGEFMLLNDFSIDKVFITTYVFQNDGIKNVRSRHADATEGLGIGFFLKDSGDQSTFSSHYNPETILRRIEFIHYLYEKNKLRDFTTEKIEELFNQ